MEFPSAEAPGISVFYRDKTGAILPTYSAYARGTENAVNTYNNLDLVPNGRDEICFGLLSRLGYATTTGIIPGSSANSEVDPSSGWPVIRLGVFVYSTAFLESNHCKWDF